MGPKGDHGDSFFTLDSASQTVHLTDYNLAVMGAPNSGKGNLIVGPNHSFAGCTNCVVFGSQNYAAGTSNIIAGHKNAVKGDFNSVGGGASNSLVGESSSIGGGQHQQAHGEGIFVSSGDATAATAIEVGIPQSSATHSMGTVLTPPVGTQLSQPGGGQLLSGGVAPAAPTAPAQPMHVPWHKQPPPGPAATPFTRPAPAASRLTSGGTQPDKAKFQDPWWYHES